MTAGASSDIEHATEIARAMVTEYGMSDLGPMNFAPQYEKTQYKSYMEPAKISDKLQERVDQEIVNLINQARDKAKLVLKKYKKKLDKISLELVKLESLDGEQFAKLMGFAKIKS